MLASRGMIHVILGFIGVAVIVLAKYLHSPILVFLGLVVAGIIYTRSRNADDSLINFSKFIIAAGITGYLVVKILLALTGLPDLN